MCTKVKLKIGALQRYKYFLGLELNQTIWQNNGARYSCNNQHIKQLDHFVFKLSWVYWDNCYKIYIFILMEKRAPRTQYFFIRFVVQLAPLGAVLSGTSQLSFKIWYYFNILWQPKLDIKIYILLVGYIFVGNVH